MKITKKVALTESELGVIIMNHLSEIGAYESDKVSQDTSNVISFYNGTKPTECLFSHIAISWEEES